MMTMRTKNEYTREILPRYLQGTKTEKGRILDEVCATTGYVRKYAIWKLREFQNHPPSDREERPRRRRRCRYGPDVRAALAVIWKYTDGICSTNLKPFLSIMVPKLKAAGVLRITPGTERLVYTVSDATIDRLLEKTRRDHHHALSGTTKPGSLLKREIAVRLGPWDEQHAGCFEIDLVAHNGGNARGDCAYTLDCVDIATGWVERGAVLGRAQVRVHAALKDARAVSPFLWKGIDSDNGSEFITHELARYCRDTNLSFTRSRPYHKNDNAHVEQKNWTAVRKILGYRRFDTQAQVDLLNVLYQGPLRLWTNCFVPIRKLREKVQTGSRVKRVYDTAATPLQRLLAQPNRIVPRTQKDALSALFASLNPVQLRREIDTLLTRLADS